MPNSRSGACCSEAKNMTTSHVNDTLLTSNVITMTVRHPLLGVLSLNPGFLVDLRRSTPFRCSRPYFPSVCIKRRPPPAAGPSSSADTRRMRSQSAAACLFFFRISEQIWDLPRGIPNRPHTSTRFSREEWVFWEFHVATGGILVLRYSKVRVTVTV
ncbi:hypothetical protein BDZ94DRAFT_1269154 [Collybia nuda]|uniref:Uncharacterized protein n=1 Tax=Collybia nuda TaxID=64659 RepID=A0A9P5XWM5_9AGAR|nr:hypothetical protein BDZ94DRAFT_1269154 [Collybia nuda]